MSDISSDKALTGGFAGFRGSPLYHRLLAFSGLIVLVVGFSLASPNFLQTANIINILQAT
jgi:ribose transport system permease protein